MTETRFGRRDPSARGYYGEYGGKFVPETLVAPVEELQAAYFDARKDKTFLAEFDRLLAQYVGRPTPVYEAARLRASSSSAKIWRTPVHTRSTTRSARRCSPSGWARRA